MVNIPNAIGRAFRLGRKWLLQRMDLSALHFCIVDDNKYMRGILRTALTTTGVREIEEYPTGVDALEAMQDRVPDIVICDWHMRPLDGLDFVRHIRASRNPRLRLVPVIMVSAYSEFSRVVAARDAGVHEFLVKPITAKRLYQRIAFIIQKPRPFIQAPGFFGPDRRRIQDPRFIGPYRRKDDVQASTTAGGMDDDDDDLAWDG